MLSIVYNDCIELKGIESMTFEEIVAQARELPLTQRKALIHELVETLSQSKDQFVEKRTFGLTKGTFVMSDDFDDELPEAFWLGEET